MKLRYLAWLVLTFLFELGSPLLQMLKDLFGRLQRLSCHNLVQFLASHSHELSNHLLSTIPS